MLVAQNAAPFDPTVLVLIFAVILLVLTAAMFALFASVLVPWLQANLSGARISVLRIVGMRLRRTNVKAVVRALILARQSGVDVSCDELERATAARAR